MSVDRWMDKEDALRIYNGILFGLKKLWKVWNLAICDNMAGPRGHDAKWSKSDRESQILFDLPYTQSLRKN